MDTWAEATEIEYREFLNRRRFMVLIWGALGSGAFWVAWVNFLDPTSNWSTVTVFLLAVFFLVHWEVNRSPDLSLSLSARWALLFMARLYNPARYQTTPLTEDEDPNRYVTRPLSGTR